MESIDRLRKATEHLKSSEKGLTNEAITLRLGYRTKGYISDLLSGAKPINSIFLDKLKAEYSINPEWVLTGIGEMVLPKPNDLDENSSLHTEVDYVSQRRELKNNRSRKAVPFFDAPAAAGIKETEMTPIHAPAGTIDVGDLLHDSEAAIRIYGNSMMPNYPPGCVIGLGPCSTEYIEPGEVYVIETKDKRIFKRLFYKDDDAESEFFMCYSDNTMKFEGGARHGMLAYPPYFLPKTEIARMFVVTGVIKRNSNSIILNRNISIKDKRK